MGVFFIWEGITLLTILNKTILIPYIHLAEREEEIWNKETEKSGFQYKIGEYLINDYLKRIKNNENVVNECFKDLFELFDNVKVADGYMNDKTQLATKATRNLGNMLIFKLVTLNKISSKLKVYCFKIPNYAYTNRWASLKNVK